MIYGYCRISRKEQNIERQVRNIKDAFPTAIVIKEAFTGATFEGRDKMNRLIAQIKRGDTIVFDSVSRMSRNADEGFDLYEQLYESGVSLVFLKEPHINTSVFENAKNTDIAMTGTSVDIILEAINKYLKSLRKEQVRLAFEQAEKELLDLRQRTKEGIETARINGKRIGMVKGSKLNVKKASASFEIIKKHSKTFGGSLSDSECISLCGISANTFYKYKAELKSRLHEDEQ